jgi:thiomorpholine-carboxylate dehydrogenase
MDQSALRDFAERYTAAWCSQDPARVASFFSPHGSLKINATSPALGRAAIREAAQKFMLAFPAMMVSMDGLDVRGEHIIYRWTLTGTNTGPGGTGQAVCINGFEEWTFGEDDLIVASFGHFDSAAYQRQLQQGMGVPRFLSEREVRSRLRMSDLIEAMERALIEFSAGRVEQPVRTVLTFSAGAAFGVMPTYVPSLPALGAKLVTICGDNARCRLDTHQAIIIMLNPETGVAEAILDGRYITEMRTAAVSAVSARQLARKDAQVLGILGSGVQARSHAEALRLVREFREVRAWSPTRERLLRFAAETGVRPMESAEAVVRGADVVVTATPSHTPVLPSEWVKDGTHVIAVGSCRPGECELDPRLVERARLVVDSRAAALKEADDVVIGIKEGRWTASHIAAELGELPTRQDDHEITVFKSLGLAIEDIFAAHLVLKKEPQD